MSLGDETEVAEAPESARAHSVPEPSARAISGQRLIFRMFVVLAVATVVILLFFATQVQASYRPRIYGALALNLVLVVAAYFILKAIGNR